jgi:hypothetical protein
MSYGGSTSLLATSTQTYKWRNNPDTSYSLFVTRFGNASTTLESHWNPKKKVTIIITPQQDVDDSDADNQMDATPVRQKLNGMIVPFLITKNGKINISY